MTLKYPVAICALSFKCSHLLFWCHGLAFLNFISVIVKFPQNIVKSVAFGQLLSHNAVPQKWPVWGNISKNWFFYGDFSVNCRYIWSGWPFVLGMSLNLILPYPRYVSKGLPKGADSAPSFCFRKHWKYDQTFAKMYFCLALDRGLSFFPRLWWDLGPVNSLSPIRLLQYFAVSTHYLLVPRFIGEDYGN